MKTVELSIHSHNRCEMIDITNEIQKTICKQQISDAIITLFTPHTTAAITINENADPDVTRDMLYGLAKLVPQDSHFKHTEGNSDAHIKSSLIGVSEILVVEAGHLLLGTWQGIYFCEFDGPRIRRVQIKVNET
jgi:secondary thiamine-phosphate synthase enzyme